MIIALDGVDRVGKSTAARELAKYGYSVISADLFRIDGKAPLGMRQWADVPILAMLTLFGANAVLDRSLISVLAYNIDPPKTGNSSEIVDELLRYVSWYERNVHFVFNTYYDIDTILSRSGDHSCEEIQEDNDRFGRAYEICGIAPLKVYAENSINDNVKTILKDLRK